MEKLTYKNFGLNKKNLKKIDDVRTETFMEKHKAWWGQKLARDGDKISYAKKLNASMMPPCERFSLNKKDE